MSQFKYNKALDHLVAAGLAYQQGDIKTAQAHLSASTKCKSFASAVAIIQHNNTEAYAHLKRVQAARRQQAALRTQPARRPTQASFPVLAAEGDDEDDLGEDDDVEEVEAGAETGEFEQEVLGEGEFETGTGDEVAPVEAFRSVAALNSRLAPKRR